MSAAPHETDAATPSLRVVADQSAPPSLAQLLGHRTPRPQHRVTPADAVTVLPAVRPTAAPPPPVQPVAAPPQRQQHVQPRAARPLREPTFDELLTGSGRRRGPQELQPGASLLRRLAQRARLVGTPARRPSSRASSATTSRATGTR